MTELATGSSSEFHLEQPRAIARDVQKSKLRSRGSAVYSQCSQQVHVSLCHHDFVLKWPNCPRPTFPADKSPRDIVTVLAVEQVSSSHRPDRTPKQVQ